MVDVTVYHLEMRSYSQRTVPTPREALLVLHAQMPDVPYYRFLYNAVGEHYQWVSRKKLSDAELATTIQHPGNELYVLHVQGVPAGFAELDCRRPEDVELKQFGLMPGSIGQGLGKWFLQWTIDRVWSRRPQRFCLHTCSLDHTAALPMYTKAGFVQFGEEVIQREA